MSTTAKKETPKSSPLIYGPDNKPIHVVDVDEIEVESPFDDSPLGKVTEFLKTHGVALSKILFMVATAAATAFGGLAAAKAGGTFNISVALMVWGCGFLLEAAFAYSWHMKGSDVTAGRQKDIIENIFNVATIVMLGDLACMLLEHQFQGNILVHWLFIGWTSAVQPFAAVYIMRAYFELKGANPITASKDRAVTLKAVMYSNAIEEHSKQLDLALQRSENQRYIDYRDMEIEREEESKVINSKRYRLIKRNAARTKLLKASNTLDGESILGKLKGLLRKN